MSLSDQSRPPNLLEASMLAGVEKAMNAGLRNAPGTRKRLAQHAGRLLCVELTLPRMNVWALIVEDGIELYHTSEAEPDVHLIGGPLDLASQLFRWRSAPGVIGGPVEIRGNRELLQELVDIVQELDLDWGGLFEPIMGSDIAQQLDYGARRFFGWARETVSRLGEQLGEYMRDESRLIALRRDVHEFNEDVDELRMDLDRLTARVERVRQRLAERNSD